MKWAVFCPLFLATILHAEALGDAETIARLTSDLLPLKSALTWQEPLKYDVYTSAELQSLVTLSLHQVIQSYENDLVALQFKHDSALKKTADADLTFKPFFNRDQAYKLTSVLAGKDLSEKNLTPLVEGIVGILNSALRCRDMASPLQSSADFRSAAEKAWTALRSLGVSEKDVFIVIDALSLGAIVAASPPRRLTYK